MRIEKRRNMRYTKNILLTSLGWTLLIVGVAGVFLPFLQGILFVVLGMIILSKCSPASHAFIIRMKEVFARTFPGAHRAFEKLKGKWHDYVSKFKKSKRP